MPATVYVRTDYGADQLLLLSAKAKTSGEARRLRAIAALVDGQTRAEAARIGGMARQTLLDWVHRYNAEGPGGLLARKPPGRPAKLSAGQRRELALIVARGQSRETAGPGRWRLVDLTCEVKRRFDIEMDPVSLSRTLKRLGFHYDGAEWRARRAPAVARGGEAGLKAGG